MMLKAVLVGTGAIAPAHVAACRDHAQRVTLAAAMNPDADQARAFCGAHGIPAVYDDLGAMLAAERPDLALIASPPAVHAAQIAACLEAGAWVLCEKPFCASLAELDRIEALERRTGQRAASVFQVRFGAAGQRLKQLLDRGELGRPLLAVCHTLWFRDAAYYAAPWRGRWASETGGTVMTHGVHEIDLLLWLLGDWREVRAVAAALDHDIEVDDAAAAAVTFANGALASVISSAVSPRQETYLRLDCQRATVEARHLYGYTSADWTYTLPPGVEDPARLARWRAVERDYPSSLSAQLAAFLDAYDQQAAPPVSGDDLRRTLAFVAALYKSAFTGQPVRQGEITPDDPFYHAMNGAPA